MAIFHPQSTVRIWHRHPYGQAVLLRDHVYVPIPKSASTWCKQLWDTGQDINVTAQPMQDLPHVVILREPVDRWVAGFAQCQVGNDPGWEGHWERLGWDWVFEQVIFDNHTEPQASYIAGLDLDRVIWFRMTDSLEPAMLDWMSHNLGIDHHQTKADRYRGQDRPPRVFRDGRQGRSQSEISEMAREALATIPGARQRIEEVYREDIELYNTMKFQNQEQ